ncbi:MAG: HAMP domain-containing histidine kinase [Spirochaetales bacterium]|nr:HAMP domain-containing histidine kinase [Spirochaetales bacterium]
MKLKRNNGRIFFRYFFATTAIAVLALVVQIAIIIGFLEIRTSKWEKGIFEEYSHSIAKALSVTATDSTMSQYIEIFRNLAEQNGRINGILIHEASGEVVQSFRFHSKDERRPARDREPQMKTVKVPMVVITPQMNSTDLESVQTNLVLPMTDYINFSQLTGIIFFKAEENQEMYIDVFTLSPSTFILTKDIFSGLDKIMLISFFLSLFVSATLAFFSSRRGSRYSNGLDAALKRIASNEPLGQLPKPYGKERISINNSIKKLSEVLERDRRSRKSWLQNISHDLKTPTASLKMLLEGMMDGVFTTDQTTLKAASMELETLIARIERISVFSDLENRTKDPKLEQFPAQTLIDTIKAFLGNASRQLEYTVQSTFLIGDFSSLALATTELISNAIKASNEKVLVNIADNHTIIIVNKGELPDQDHIMEIWERGDIGRNSKGNGLGISIIQQVMRIHHGQFTLVQNQGNVVASISWDIPNRNV